MKILPGRRFMSCHWLIGLLFGGLLTLSGYAQTLYSFGNPTAEEQAYIEYINYARANPSAEGALLAATTDPYVLADYTYYGVVLSEMESEFSALAAVPPLAPNADLATAARGHSTWMFNNQTQSHNETNPSNTFSQRMTAAGYVWSSAGENIFCYADEPWHGHAGFEVDWGPDANGNETYGMQGPPRGHRANIHSSGFSEIGVGVVDGTNGSIGPQTVTQDFGSQLNSPPTLATGVAYYDLNGNGTYDAGEGISGLAVNVSGASYYCTTAAGGGWVVPVPSSAATRTVTFTGLGINQTVSLTVPANTNAKADLKLAYSPPTITSTSTALSGSTYTLAFNAVGGATGYTWNIWNYAAAPGETCDSTANITSTTTGSYSVLDTTNFEQGTGSFHLQDPTGASQYINLNSLYYGQTGASISFQSSLGEAFTTEIAKVQVQALNTTTWQDVYDQAGASTASNVTWGETTWNLRTASLSSMQGKVFRIRFVLFFPGSGYYPGSTTEYSNGEHCGWLVDAITFSNVSILTNNVQQALSTNSGSFTPGAGSYLMSVAPVISGSNFPAALQTLTVANGQSQTITFAALATQTYGNAPFTLGATASSGLAVSYSSSNTSVATVSDNTVTIVGAGSSTITASQAGNSTYSAAANVTQVLTVNPASQTITFGSLPAKTYGNPTFTLSATASSGLAVSYTSSNPLVATVSGSTVTITGGGTSTMTASQPGNTNYSAAANVTQVLTVNPAAQTITFGSLPAKTYGNPAFTLGATASSGLAVSYASSNPSVATVSGNTVTITGGGTSTITASQAGNANYCAATNASQIFTVNPATQTITFGSLATQTYGNGPLTLSATASSGLAVVYTSSNTSVATVSGNTLTFTGAGTSTITASQAGNADYSAATNATQTLTVNKGSQTITFGALGTQMFSPTPLTLTATSSSGLAITYTSSKTSVATVSGNILTFTGVGSSTITASQAGNTNYNAAANVGQTLTVSKGSQTITFGSLAAQTCGNGPLTLTATASSGLAVGYASSNTSVATVSGSTVTIVGAGTSTITASQAGNADYCAATSVAQPLTVNPGFKVWAAACETANRLPAGTIANNPLGSVDHDGRNNFLDYAFGISPVNAAVPAPHLPVVSSNATYSIMSYQVDTSLTDLTFTPQASSDMIHWIAPGGTGAPPGFGDTVTATNGTIQTHQASIPRTTAGNWFMRVQIYRP